MTPEEVVRFCHDRGVEIIDLKFTDVPGTLHHLSIPRAELTEPNMGGGIRLRRVQHTGVQGNRGKATCC